MVGSRSESCSGRTRASGEGVGPFGPETSPSFATPGRNIFFFENDQLSGLVDFGAMGIESVATDLARLIGEWFDGEPNTRSEALTAYEQVRPLDPGEARLIPVFEATTALLIGERWARWHFVENRHFDDPEAVSKGLDRGLGRLERLARELYGSRRFF